MTMDEHAMTQGVIPVRHPSLGVVKLPKRYEKAALGDPRTARHRKFSICTEPARMRETISGRLDDLMTAIMWVKQELILLRQHDILLKRQFFNINDSIQTLHARKAHLASSSSSSGSPTATSPRAMPPPPSSTSSSLSSSSLSSSSTAGTKPPHPGSSPDGLSSSSSPPPSSPATNGLVNPAHSALSSSPAGSTASDPASPARIRALLGLRKLPAASSDLQLDAFHMRPSSSATVLNSPRGGGSDVVGGGIGSDDGSDDDTDGDDTFDEQYYRPRTSSMRTSRDLAALARRRGSKELNQLI